MTERELVTVAFGNYSTLVAAQWVNGTSVYDQHHRTLFSERAAGRVLGGAGGGSGTARVPRLLLFDAPHASTFEDVKEVEERLAREQSHNEDVSEETALSTLWGSPTAALTREEQQLQSLAQQLENQWWDRGAVQLDSDDEDIGNESGEEEEEGARASRAAADDRRPFREDGYEYSKVLPDSGVTGVGAEDDPGERETGGEEGGSGGEATSSEVRRTPPLSRQELRQLKRRLFRMRDRTVPWWRYVSTGLDRDSVLALQPLHQVDGGGEIPLLHSAGFGLRSLRPNTCVEVEQLGDGLRRHAEDADHLQGIQTFIDGDSLFAGVAHNVLESFWEDEGSKVPVTLFTAFPALPPALTDPAQASQVAFAERRQEEVWLNRLLSTSCLSASPSALYVPVEVGHWEKLFAAGHGAALTDWLEDDTATAQYLATIADTALYGVRDGLERPTSVRRSGQEEEGGSLEHRSEAEAGLRRGRRPRAVELPPAVGESSGPAYYLSEWQCTVRPTPSMRVAALMGVLPIRLAGNQQRDLWECLERGAPLLSAPHDASWGHGFVPLSHAMPKAPSSEAGRVVGHAVTLRGPGQLPSQVYPTREALLRYALPLRTSTYLPLLTRTNYPLSSTFPMSMLFPKDDITRLEAQLPVGKSLRDALSGVDVGAHTLTTYNSAPMLQDMVNHCEKILRYKAHVFSASYGMEKDDWTERLEDVKEIHDDYRHEDYIDEHDDSDNDGSGW